MRHFKQILQDRFAQSGNEDPVKTATEAVKEWLGEEVAKKFVIAKAEGYDKVLKKYGMKQIGFVKDEVNAIHCLTKKHLNKLNLII